MIIKFENYIFEKSDYININGTQRSTKNSNGEFITDNEENLRNFYEWFGNSEIIDSKGRPLVVYHGTTSNFNIFKPSKKIGTHGETDQIEGMYFTDNIDGASFFSNSDDSRYLKSVYLSIQNPYVSDTIKNLKESLNLNYLGDVSDKVKNIGHDGLIIEKGFYAYGGPHKKIITFSPNQIKSIKNNGNFNMENDSIYESIKNPTYTKNEVKSILSEIQKLTPTIKKNNITFDDSSKMFYYLEIRHLDIKCEKEIDKIIKNKQEKLLKAGIILYYKSSHNALFDFEGDGFDIKTNGEYSLTYYIYFKDLYTKRYLPHGYLYHASPTSNRESIQENGLQLGKFENSKWSKESIQYAYPPAIFATPEIFGWYLKVARVKDGADIWRIDTKTLKNVWWEDLNFYRHLDKMKPQVQAVMTFEPIPPEYLKLTKKPEN